MKCPHLCNGVFHLTPRRCSKLEGVDLQASMNQRTNSRYKKTFQTAVQTHAHRVEGENVLLAVRGVQAKVDVLFVDVVKASDVLAPLQ